MRVIFLHIPQGRVGSIAYFISGIILGHLFHGLIISFHQLSNTEPLSLSNLRIISVDYNCFQRISFRYTGYSIIKEVLI